MSQEPNKVTYIHKTAFFTIIGVFLAIMIYLSYLLNSQEQELQEVVDNKALTLQVAGVSAARTKTISFAMQDSISFTYNGATSNNSLSKPFVRDISTTCILQQSVTYSDFLNLTNFAKVILMIDAITLNVDKSYTFTFNDNEGLGKGYSQYHKDVLPTIALATLTCSGAQG